MRDWLTSPAPAGTGTGQPPPPLPDEVVERTRARYIEAYERLTGREVLMGPSYATRPGRWDASLLRRRPRDRVYAYFADP